MMTPVEVMVRAEHPTPWAIAASPSPFPATMIGRPKPLPSGGEVALVVFPDQPHWSPGFRVTVYGLAVRNIGGSWEACGLQGESALFGPLDAQTWRDRFVDRAWAGA